MIEKNVYGESSGCEFATQESDTEMICLVTGKECMYGFMPVSRGCTEYYKGESKYKVKK